MKDGCCLRKQTGQQDQDMSLGTLTRVSQGPHQGSVIGFLQ